MGAGSPETDQPTPPLRKALRPARVGTLPRARVGGLASRLQATARTAGEKAPKGTSPGRTRIRAREGPGHEARDESNAVKADADAPPARETRRRSEERRVGKEDRTR